MTVKKLPWPHSDFVLKLPPQNIERISNRLIDSLLSKSDELRWKSISRGRRRLTVLKEPPIQWRDQGGRGENGSM